MRSLYSAPLRVYLCLGALALVGIYSGLKLPVSLFPNSSKPTIAVNIPYGGSTADEFLNAYGRELETKLRTLSNNDVQVEEVTASYEATSVDYRIKFRWGTPDRGALKEVQTTVSAFGATLPEEIRLGINVWSRAENSGFLAVSFFSQKRSLDELYNVLEPILVPRITKVREADDAELWNPSRKEVRIELNPEAMASLGLLPRDLDRAISAALGSQAGGSVSVGIQQLTVQLPRQVSALEDLPRVLIRTPSGHAVHLGDIARIDLGPRSRNSHSFKTNGAPSLILWATPRPGGNVKKMSEDMIAIVRELAPTLPADIQYKVLVDPSEFIRSSIRNVMHEVALGALLAVGILFLFIGSLRNTATAAIEIPLSIVLAFILMRISGMNLNLISLGGLALSAGMNVDASVVVIENIFRHFEGRDPEVPLDASERLDIVTRAVAEVRFPVIASTLASLVVFLPLAFTSDLTYAILGDLAKTVVFSHGVSAIVALILVPTIRLQLMSRRRDGRIPPPEHSPIESWIRRLEQGYGRALGRFLDAPKARRLGFGALIVLLPALGALILPNLPKEIIGTPDTDWIMLGMNTRGNTSIRQMETQTEETEARFLKEFGAEIQYTFSQINDNNRGIIMARLVDKSTMRDLWKRVEARYTNTPFVKYWVAPWNPAELPIPNPPDLRIAVRGGSVQERALVAERLRDLLEEKKVFDRAWTQPDVWREHNIFIEPNREQWTALGREGHSIQPSDLADLARVATHGRRVGRLPLGGIMTDIMIRYPENAIGSAEELGALPIGLGGKLVPLKALARVSICEVPPITYREDERELVLVQGKQNEAEKGTAPQALRRAKEVVATWQKERSAKPQADEGSTTIAFEDAQKDLNDALFQLGIALALSVLLIFVTLIFQFGDVMNSLLVLVAIPLGFIGVLISLFVFRSTLSLNSVLGVILLNGIAVANSIILVDFLKRRVEEGLAPRAAAIEAASKRLRPILITSLTTVLGMLPIALGMGEGGRILQPLGIAVSGGLWLSMGLTLFIVPALQVAYLERKFRSTIRAEKRTWLARVRRARTATAVLALAAFGTGIPEARAESPETLTFTQALQRIVERSTALETQRAELGAVEARNLPSYLALAPALSFSMKRTTQNSSLSGNTANLNAEGLAELNLFKFGADFAGIRAAKRLELAQANVVEATALRVEGEAIRALMLEIQRNLEIGILTRLVAAQTQLADVGHERYRLGLLSLQEAQKLTVDRDNAAARLSNALINESQARANLGALLGGARIEARWPWREGFLVQSMTGVPIEELQMDALPAYRTANSRVDAEAQRKSQKFGLIFPSLDAQATIGRYQGFPPQLPATLQTAWSASLLLTIPLFDRLTRYSEFQAQGYSLIQAETQREQVRRDAQSEWEAARQTFSIALQSARAREGTLGVARKLYEDNVRFFRNGRVSANDLIVNGNRLFDSELLEVEGWAAAHLAWARVCHSAGRRISQCQRTPEIKR